MLKQRLAIAAIATAAVISSAAPAHAQPYPNRVIRIFASEAGSNVDLVARVLAQGLSTSLGRQLIVDNRPGIVAIETTAKAPADGYTLLLYTSAVWTLPLMKETSFDPVKDLVPITLATNSPLFLFINPTVPAKNVRELVALAKAKPGDLNYAMSGNGTSNHLASELFNSMAGVNIVRIAYKGSGPASLALVANQVQMMFSSVAAGMQHVQTGKLRVLAVASAQPSALAPDLPTIAASGVPGYEMGSISAMWAPANTPKDILSRLNQETLRVLARPDVREKFISFANEAIGNTPEQAAAYIDSDMTKWRKVIKEAGIRAD